MTVRVVHGANDLTFPLAGRTIRFVAKKLRDVFNIPQGADALLNGSPSNSETVLATGDLLEFVQPLGHKGCGSEYLSVAEVRRMVGDRGIRELGAEGVIPTEIPVYETACVLRWVNEKLEFDSHIVRERRPVSARSLTVDPDTRQASYKGNTIELSDLPFDLLYVLVKEFRAGRKHALAKIKYSVWRDDLTSDDTVRRTISRLRKALKSFPSVQLTLADMRVELSIE